MLATALVDTGAILALLDGRDKWHDACVKTFREMRLPLATTIAVLTELFQLTIRDFGSMEPAWELINTQSITVVPVSHTELPRIRELMEKYRDHPMDFADATLVHVADRESISIIFTIDHDDFETYRLAGNKKFTIRPHRTALRQF